MDLDSDLDPESEASEKAKLLADDEEVKAGGTLAELIAAASKGGRGVTKAQVSVLAKMLTWPEGSLFPALDIARLTVLDPNGSRLLFSDLPPALLLRTLLRAAGASPSSVSTPSSSSTPPLSPLAVNLQLACRFAANCFRNAQSRQWILDHRETLLNSLGQACVGHATKVVRSSWACLLQNVAAAAAGGEAEETGAVADKNGSISDMELAIHVLSGAVETIQALTRRLVAASSSSSSSSSGSDASIVALETAFQEDSEALISALRAVGMILHSQKGSETVGLALDLGLSTCIHELVPRVSSVVAAPKDASLVLGFLEDIRHKLESSN
mmetsp:Transcript_6870/g.13517  ORF Transcript_6870/g.13517 Transcript_6870/m.13517 type:complete len:327 (-) Transcript_6870:491-1471(-)